MGSGKSTIGPLLANAIGYDFKDVDRMIEQWIGRSINEIFRDEGEEHFRRLERKVVEYVCDLNRVVVALGGGTLNDLSSFARITEAGILIYLKMTPDQLFERLRTKTNRPMLAGLSGEELDEEPLRARIWDLFRSREPYYNRADITVMTGDVAADPVIEEIVRKLHPYFG
jgi:shikimate kinase